MWESPRFGFYQDRCVRAFECLLGKVGSEDEKNFNAKKERGTDLVKGVYVGGGGCRGNLGKHGVGGRGQERGKRRRSSRRDRGVRWDMGGI